MINAALKEELHSMCALVDAAGDLAEIEDMSCAARMEMAKYLMWLSACDGKIEMSEAMVISSVLDFDVDAQWVSEFIREQNVCSADLQSTCPPVLTLLIAIDNERYTRGDTGSRSVSEIMVNLYKKIGVELIKSDGDVHGGEKVNFGVFTAMLDRYLNENLLSRKA